MTLSIITINYNNSRGLQQTIQSVLQQSFKDYEYIIIDGGSTDESIEIIKKYETKISYWKSEKDNGVYHAMNKGITIAKGEYLLMLNSGDYLFNSSVLTDVFKSRNYNEDILYGQIEWQNNGQFYEQSNYPQTLSSIFFWEKSIGHQAAFIKKTVHDIVGLYDETMKICADWKFFLLASQKYHLQFRFLPFVVATGDNSGLSWNQANYFIIKKEKVKTIKKYFRKDYQAYKHYESKHGYEVRIRINLMKQRLKRVFKLAF